MAMKFCFVESTLSLSYCWASKITQWVNMFTTNTDDLSLIPRTHRLDSEN